MNRFKLFSCLAVGFLAACAVQPEIVKTVKAPTPTETTLTVTLPPPLTPTYPAPLTLSEARLRNMTFNSPVYDRRVTLIDGSFEGTDDLRVNLLPHIGFGDLNGDGREDAAVMLAENSGGSGTFISLVIILNQDGQSVQAGATMIDDRPIISSVVIVDGEILVEAVVHSTSDPGCCPALAVLQTYAWDEGSLVMLRRTSLTSSGAVREILIESPSSGSEVGISVQVQGGMPIAPFENNLLYRVYDLNFNMLDAGPFAVIASEMGAPATFNNSLNSPAFVPGTTVWLELSENSMADGTPLAIERVKLKIK